MTETIETKAGTSVSDRLRQLADWLESHEVKAKDVVICNVDGWGDMDAHLTQSEVIRLCGQDGVTMKLDKSGNVHGIGWKDGVRVVFCSRG